MTIYSFEINETVVTERLVTVKADSLEEARGKAERGDTETETDIGMGQVINREIYHEL